MFTRGERQWHGFVFEEQVIEKYSMKKSEDYTAVWDAHLGEIPVSIKTKKQGGAVEMGDFFRQSKVDKDFLLCVGFWDREKTNIVEEHYLLISKDYWTSQFDPGLTESFKNIFDGISNSYKDDEKWRARMREANQAWDVTGSIIKTAFKRDHKSQKRVQCHIRREAFEGLTAKYSVDPNELS